MKDPRRRRSLVWFTDFRIGPVVFGWRWRIVSNCLGGGLSRSRRLIKALITNWRWRQRLRRRNVGRTRTECLIRNVRGIRHLRHRRLIKALITNWRWRQRRRRRNVGRTQTLGASLRWSSGRRLIKTLIANWRWRQLAHFVASRHIDVHTSAPRKNPASMQGTARSVEIMPNWLPFDQETAPRTRASGPRMIGKNRMLARAQTSPAIPSSLPSSVWVIGEGTTLCAMPHTLQKPAPRANCAPQLRQIRTSGGATGGGFGSCGADAGGGGFVGGAAASGGYHLPSEAFHQPDSGAESLFTGALPSFTLQKVRWMRD